MRNNLVLERRPPQRSWQWLQVIVLIAFCLCLLLGFGAVYLLWSINRQPPPSLLEAPEQTLLVEQIVPQLAIRHLAGDPLDGLSAQAIQADESATGHALLLFDAASQPVFNITLWLQLAQQEAAHQQWSRGAQATQMAQRIALLDPRLLPLEKVQFLTQCAKVYATAGYNEVALFAIRQATTLAAQTPALLPAQRSQLFSALQPIFADLAESAESRTLKLRIDDFTRNPFLSPTGLILTPTLFSLAESTPLFATIAPALLTRQSAAKALADRYLLTNGVDVEPERAALLAALLAEEKARLQMMQLPLTGTNSLAQQFTLLLAQRDRLVTRLRIARLGYGISLVPLWETDSSGVRRYLATNTANLDTLFEKLISTQPTPQQQARLRLEATLWLAEQAEIGLYPATTIADLAIRVQSAQAEVERLIGALALPIVYEPNLQRMGFDLQQK